MGGCSSGYHAGEIPGNDHIGCCTADTLLETGTFAAGIDPAGPHVTNVTAEPLLSEAASRCLFV